MEFGTILGIPLQGALPIMFVLGAMIANAFPGIPEEVFLLTLGYLINTNPELYSFPQIYVLMVIGFLLVDSIVYYMSYKGNRIIKFITNKVLDMDLEEHETFFRTHMDKTIFITRFIVQFRALGPIVSGTFRFPYKRFIAIDFFALVFYVPLLLWIGFYFSNRIERILNGANVVSNIMFGFLILVLAIILITRLRKVFLRFMRSAGVLEGEKN